MAVADRLTKTETSKLWKETSMMEEECVQGEVEGSVNERRRRGCSNFFGWDVSIVSNPRHPFSLLLSLWPL